MPNETLREALRDISVQTVNRGEFVTHVEAHVPIRPARGFQPEPFVLELFTDLRQQHLPVTVASVTTHPGSIDVDLDLSGPRPDSELTTTERLVRQHLRGEFGTLPAFAVAKRD